MGLEAIHCHLIQVQDQGLIFFILSLGKAAIFPPKEKEEIGPGSYYITGTIGIIPKYHFDKNRDKM